ncbi:MAG: hypothetical protein KC656_05490 [Myxococcales bacterium]|nr:hypothetical protein [Myxococcales bacterium]MCB9668237.1 hypothetical protein [Alphaproteobacteria bacterium]MCB9692577.1 hypothetical protein [Alphaproteobacteria bacterium]
MTPRTTALLGLLVPVLAVLSACGTTQKTFAEDFVELYCSEHADCDRIGRPCPVRISEEGAKYRDCAFDAALAESCLAGAFTCDDSVPENASVIVPEDCLNVCGDIATGAE